MRETKNMLGNLPLDITCSSKLTTDIELRSIVRFLKQKSGEQRLLFINVVVHLIYAISNNKGET